MKNLTKRLTTAGVFIPLLVFIIYMGGIYYLILVLVFTVLGLNEFYTIMKTRGYNPWKVLGMIGGGLLVAGTFILDSYFLNIYFTLLILSILVAQLFRRELEVSISRISVTLFGILYPAWLLSHAVLLRNLTIENPGSLHLFNLLSWGKNTLGISLVLFTLAATFMNDTGAYFIGRKWGKNKLARRVSPNKTVEGLVGGIIFTIITCILMRYILSLSLDYINLIVLALVLSLSALLGDLVESMLKREVDIKDSGNIFPGHGGILDRADSLLFTLPIAYYYLKTYYMFKS